MPFITNLWFRFAVGLVGATLRPPNLSKGYTPDMVVPIYSNTSHAGGRASVQSTTPFPFDNCYHWLESMATVRLRRKADLFDEASAVQIEVMQHVVMARRSGEDFRRSVPLKTAQNAREPLPAHAVGHDGPAPPSVLPRPVCSSSQDSRLSASGGSRPPCGDLPSPGSGNSDVSEPDAFEADMEALSRMVIFGLAHDLTAERLPLADLWLELTDRFTADTIPSPLEFYKEVGAIVERALSFLSVSLFGRNDFVLSD